MDEDAHRYVSNIHAKVDGSALRGRVWTDEIGSLP
jgi:hypothetical protein